MKFQKVFVPKQTLTLPTILALTTLGVKAQVLEEVIVTAQKREESMQEIGVSVTAFSGDLARELGFIRSVDIAAHTPSLNIGTPVGEGNNPSITLRGVGLNDFNDNNEGPVALYRDDVYVGNMAGQTFQLFDIERIEVLRGPQGTLYGRNATGGLLHYIANRPTQEFDLSAHLTVASESQIQFEGAVGGPVADAVQVRLAGATNQHDGYVENRIGSNPNEADSKAIRGLLNIDLSADASLLLNVHYGKSDPLAAAYQHEATIPDLGGADLWGYGDADNDNFAGEYNRTGVLDIETSGASATFEWSSGIVDFTSITAVDNVEKAHAEDTDMGPISGIVPDFRANYEQFTQEFRIMGETDRLNYVAGLYLFESDVQGDYLLEVDYFGGFLNFLDSLPESEGGFEGGLALVGAPFGEGDLLGFLNYDVDYDQKSRSNAIFGQMDYSLSDSLFLTAGLRYTSEDKDYVYTNVVGPRSGVLLDFFQVVGVIDPVSGLVYDYTPGGADVIAGNSNVIDSKNVSGKLGLEWNVSDGAMIFANYSRGFKSGGFNAGFMDIDMQVARDAFGVNTQYDDETLDSFEIGIKSLFANGRARFNATAFAYDYRDFQALTFFGISQFIVNTDAVVNGAELELVASPTDGWYLNFGMSLLDTEIAEVRNLNTGDLLNGTKMVLAPELSYNGLARYSWDVGEGSLSVQADFNHQDDHYFDVVNQPIALEGAYTVWNARMGYEFGAEREWELAIWGKNLTNKEYRTYTFDFTGPGGFNQQFFAPPRWMGLTLSYRY